jgi:hypothetical protein
MVLALIFQAAPASFALQSFQLETEEDVPLKHQLPIYLQHALGDVSVSGWVQDRIRVKMKYRVFAENQEQADREFKKLELISLETRDRFELRIGHSRGTDLVSKLRDRSKNPVQVDLEIKAPYQSDLTLLPADGKSLKVEQWRGGVSITGKNNQLHLSKLNLSRKLQIHCLSCETEVRESRLGGRIVIGSKPVILSQVEIEDSLSIDAGNEEVRADKCLGKLSVHTKGGRLNVTNSKGFVSLQSEEGGAYLTQFIGGGNLQTQSGQVMLDFDEVSSSVNVDTEKSDIQISLPAQHEGAIDLMSLRGEVIVQFPYEALKGTGRELYGPASPGKIDGVIGTKEGHLIHAYSKQGGVRLLRKAPVK